MNITLTYIGSATVLLRIGEITILTDPTFDPAATSQSLSLPGTDISVPLQRRVDPAIRAADLPPIDLVLLSHDEHPDNFDTSGRAVAANARSILTTVSGAQRLGQSAIGLHPGDRIEAAPGIHITATPAQHTEPHLLAVAGDVIGFIIEIDGTPNSIYITGDTLNIPELAGLADNHQITTILAHVGDAHFDLSGDTPFSMTIQDALTLGEKLNARTVIPIHEDDWKHFRTNAAEDSDNSDNTVLCRLKPGATTRLQWPTLAPIS